MGLLIRGIHYTRHFSSVSQNQNELSHLTKLINISKARAEYLAIRHPVIKKMDKTKLKELIDTLHDLGYPKETLVKEPLLFSLLPITLRYRYRILNECGITNITASHVAAYLNLVKQKTIGELKKSGEIQSMMNVENRLASYMTQWPTSLTTLINDDVNNYTLQMLRLRIIQRYLELVLDLTNEEFNRGILTYPTIKHRPLEVLNETLTMLQSQIMLPTHKIKSNLYLVQADPDNLRQIIYNFRSIGGIDIKEVIRLHPKVATKNFSSLMAIREVLQEYGISNEAQKKCFEIYTLGPNTIRERLENAKTIPEFNAFFNHPRFLKMIYFNKTAMKRLMTLYNNNKKCLSLNILSGSSSRYEAFEKAPGDRLGKGKDLIFCLTQALGRNYTSSEVRQIIRRHPFWINIPLVQVKFVHQQLSKEYTPKDIFENCPILLYPWNKVNEALSIMNKRQKHVQNKSLEHLNLSCLNNSQKLSLALYFLESNHYFSGNGVWTEEKNKPAPNSLQLESRTVAQQ
ncbi:transcription termination factor 5, mitochondrial isoform X1 [Hyposmocoma kahamanoa]|uniref:transcription termination factor 5, mitochondrial isoform X1 n=1 Tax=Hyposmocoma kahamanoa TaxID=1477025 RepID=UPI000E6D85B3|nr:transcription termination factor 5, mitochondrial isoform X1 [Hyposmocoma kahamanoa]